MSLKFISVTIRLFKKNKMTLKNVFSGNLYMIKKQKYAFCR